MAYFTTNLTTAVSSTPGASTVCNLNWIGGKPITVLVFSTNASASAVFQVQYTLDDSQRSSAPNWHGVSSAYTGEGVSVSSASFFQAATAGSDGLIINFLSPVAGVRINSTSMTAGPLTLQVIQPEGW